jgi:hypothetical protein
MMLDPISWVRGAKRSLRLYRELSVFVGIV